MIAILELWRSGGRAISWFSIAPALTVGIEGSVELSFPLVKAAQEKPTEVHVPDFVLNFLQTNAFSDQRMADVQPGVLPAHAAVSTDIAHLEVALVLDLRNS